MLRYLLPALLVATPAAAMDDLQILPKIGQRMAAKQIIDYGVTLAKCPDVKPGPRAGALWSYLKIEFSHTPMDEPAIRQWVKGEIAKQRQTALKPYEGWCEHAKQAYGRWGNKARDAVVMRDGEKATPACVLDGSCSAANTIDVYLY